MNARSFTIVLLSGAISSCANAYYFANESQSFDEEPSQTPGLQYFKLVQIVPKPSNVITFAEQKRHSRSCTQILVKTRQSVVLHSPNYPREYPKKIQTNVCFLSPSGTTMSVHCEDFNVEHSRRCRHAYFGLGLDGNVRSLVKYCGKGTFRSSSSSINSLAVVFKSHLSNRKRNPYRFRCTVTVSESCDIATTTTSVSGSTPTFRSTTTTSSSGDSENCTCGRRNDDAARIVGGTDAKANEFPWRCYLITDKTSLFCGCAILSNRWILTAAHCVTTVMPLLQSGDNVYVVMGDHDISTTDTTSQKITVESYHVHQQFNSVTRDNDVSLLKLSHALTFSTAISPICLPYKYANDDFDGSTVVTSGWGATSHRGSPSNTLKKVLDLPVLTTQQCEQYYRGKLTDRMICTYNPGKDTCQGDSGGSIDLNRNGLYYHIGVASWGIDCARENYPGVYAKTTEFLDWIETTSGESFCIV